jgi:UDP-2,3-diacylglucosamine hydrolase
MSASPHSVFFISDAHLGTPDSTLERVKLDQLKSFFDYISKKSSALYILGDYFDFWFEYKHAVPKACLEGLHRLMDLAEKGVAIHYLSGNHDHWVYDFFEKHAGITVHPGSYDLEISGLKILLYHGDGVSALDGNYRIMKKILRHKISIFLYRWIHPDIGLPLGNRMSHFSKNQDLEYQKYVNDASIDRFLNHTFARGYDMIIMGHHHQPKEALFGTKKYINLGDWVSHFTYAEASNNTVELKKWTGYEIL